MISAHKTTTSFQASSNLYLLLYLSNTMSFKIELCGTSCSIFNYGKNKQTKTHELQKLSLNSTYCSGRSYRKEKKKITFLNFFPDGSHFTDHPCCLSLYFANSTAYFESSALLHVICSSVFLLFSNILFALLTATLL